MFVEKAKIADKMTRNTSGNTGYIPLETENKKLSENSAKT